jgi:very-short-patch-repair endonuclease
MPTRAQRLRKNPTPIEIRLWRLLHPFRAGGYHFRKQAPIGPYVVDFACHHAKLVIEVDGDTHATDAGMRHDKWRDAFLQAEGYRILRLWNNEVMRNPEGVYFLISQALGAISSEPPGSTSPLVEEAGRGVIAPIENSGGSDG